MGDLPRQRSLHQKYVFANIEAAANYRMCSNLWNGYFNWTWTYKLNSDAVWGYFIVRNASKHVIGPQINVPWVNAEEMDPVDDELKMKLRTKTKASAWFVSNCYTVNRREEYVENIKKQLSLYNLTLDIYGECGSLQCPKNIMSRCLKHLQHNYYFYFAFENALNEDYLTEKVLHALNYNTVPVVLSGVDYSRFLPPGSFLDALALGPEKLAKSMYDIIQNPTLYYKFFRWRNYYSFHLRHESPNTDDYCHFCAMANDDNLMSITSIYEDFDSWWNSSLQCNHLFYDDN
ncbi:alpha-(1,3)-fucosyltransferase C [Manduca sexta]|uniref:alpha-(1,3)-fucosyltransferase C n=1 Tax=Manduca sexta TaxID=7130 RepID=UPI001890257B|nr:alpha-(1,3)-fucosyltransferase C [Manduca sexta]